MKHKMATHTSESQEKLTRANQRLECINYYVGCYFCCYCCNSSIERKKQKRNERLSSKIELIKSKLMAHDSMKRSADEENAKVLKKITRSLKRTFSPHNHEGAYFFEDLDVKN